MANHIVVELLWFWAVDSDQWLAAGVLALSVTCGDSSPKGRALGKTKDFAVLPMPLPSGEVALRKQ